MKTIGFQRVKNAMRSLSKSYLTFYAPGAAQTALPEVKQYEKRINDHFPAKLAPLADLSLFSVRCVCLKKSGNGFVGALGDVWLSLFTHLGLLCAFMSNRVSNRNEANLSLKYAIHGLYNKVASTSCEYLMIFPANTGNSRINAY